MKISKNRYLQGFGIVVLLLALVRVIFPGVAKPKTAAADAADSTLVAAKDSAASDASSAEISDAPAGADGNVAEDLKKDELSVMPDTAQSGKPSIFFDKDGKEVKHRIFSVPHFGNTFPDQQDVQILDGVEGIGVVKLGQKDIVRHKLVTRIVNAYDKYDKERAEAREAQKAEKDNSK